MTLLVDGKGASGAVSVLYVPGGNMTDCRDDLMGECVVVDAAELILYKICVSTSIDWLLTD